MDRGVQGATVRGVTESDTTEHAHTERKIGVKDLKQY